MVSLPYDDMQEPLNLCFFCMKESGGRQMDHRLTERMILRRATLLKTFTLVIIGLLSFWAILFMPNKALAGRTDAVVLVNSASASYADFQHYIKPYLDNFGVPYTTLDIATDPVGVNIEDYAVIIIGHRQLDPDRSYLDPTEEGYISAAVTAGTGLVNFDNYLSNGSAPYYQFVDDIFGFGYMSPPTGSGVTFTSEGYTGIRIDCWDDAHQDPVLTTTTDPLNLVETDGLWTEFLYTQARDYPSVLAGADEESYGLPVMRFYASGIPNGSRTACITLSCGKSGR